jgi:hypothetical protein
MIDQAKCPSRSEDDDELEFQGSSCVRAVAGLNKKASSVSSGETSFKSSTRFPPEQPSILMNLFRLFRGREMVARSRCPQDSRSGFRCRSCQRLLGGAS